MSRPATAIPLPPPLAPQLPCSVQHGVRNGECLTYDAPQKLSPSSVEPQGRCPSGTMTVQTSDVECPGFSPPTTTIEIEYSIPRGTQLSYHQNPGTQYGETTRKVFLPNNEEGRRLLTRLKYAWMHGLSFNIGTSELTGKRNSVVWSKIPHKTSLHGGTYGFPDTNYIANCNIELDKLNVPDADTCQRPQFIRRQSTAGKHVVCTECLTYEAPLVLSASGCLAVASQPLLHCEGDCPICFDDLNHLPAVQIKGCNHSFHYKCIDDCLKHESKCPVCRTPVGEPQGRSPSGTMSIEAISKPCPGFGSLFRTTTIQIVYSIPRGTQRSYHENPGIPYGATTRTAYLPNNKEGRRLLTRLKYAWMHGLTFTVGTSLTTRQANSCTWTSIHHKTSLNGGPHGFPAPDYIDSCNKTLDALNVPDADDCL